MGDWRVHFPVIGADYDAGGNPILRPCEDLLNVRNGYDKLALVPYKPNRVIITGLAETDSTSPANGEYRVNYVTGRIYFNEAQEGQVFTAKYDGIGTLVGMDEINWLWERTSKYADYEYYTALKDTPSILIPRAVQVANKTADKITQMSPYIGRSYCDAFLLPDWQGNFKFSGSIFDMITVFKIELGLQEPEIIDFSNGIIDNLTTTGNSFIGGTGGGYLWSVAVLNSIGKRSVGSITLGDHTGQIGILLSVERVYHKWNGTEWEIVGDYGTTKNLPITDWNTPAEIAAIPYLGLKELMGKNISVAVFAAEGATFSPTFSVSVMNAESFTQINSNATFSIKQEEWTVILPNKANWVVVRGSGRDDVCCQSEVIEFTDVNPGEIVSVKAPVRTNVNVLFSGTRSEAKVYFPPEWRSWQPFFNDKTHLVDRKVLPYLAYPTLFTDDERDNIFSSLSAAQKNLTVAYDLRDGKWDNFISNLTYSLYKISNFVPGNVSPAVIVGPSNRYIQMLPYAAVTVSSSGFYAPKSIGFLFRIGNENQTVTILSQQHGDTRYDTITFRVHDGNLYAYANLTRQAEYGTNVVIDRLICGIRKKQWNSFILIGIRYQFVWSNGSTSTGRYYGRVMVNGTVYDFMMATVAYASIHERSIRFPTTIGPDPVNAYASQNSGSAFISLPFATQFKLTDAQASDISAKMLALGAQNRPEPASTAISATEALFMENMNVQDYATMSLSDGWQYMPHEPLFAFWDDKKLLTIRRNMKEVIELPVTSEYDDIRAICADITTLRMNADLLASDYFANYQLICFTKDEGRYHQLYGPPGQLVASGTQIYNEWTLVNSTSARVQYIDGEWKVKNLTNKICDVRVAILGGSILSSAANGNIGDDPDNPGGWSLVEKFVDLLDTPATLYDDYPKTLVSLKGMVQKAPYIHPFLLRHL